MSRSSKPPDTLEDLLRPAAIGHALEERQHAAEPVWPRVVELVDPPPEQVRGAVEPPMLNPTRMQRRRDLPGGEERCPLLHLPPGSARPPLDRRLHERRAALVGRVGREPLTCACDKLLIPRVGLVERVQSHRDGRRLAGRHAPVRLERVTESAVGVAEGGDRVADR
jgi:hypothetical protein